MKFGPTSLTADALNNEGGTYVHKSATGRNLRKLARRFRHIPISPIVQPIVQLYEIRQDSCLRSSRLMSILVLNNQVLLLEFLVVATSFSAWRFYWPVAWIGFPWAKVILGLHCFVLALATAIFFAASAVLGLETKSSGIAAKNGPAEAGSLNSQLRITRYSSYLYVSSTIVVWFWVLTRSWVGSSRIADQVWFWVRAGVGSSPIADQVLMWFWVLTRAVASCLRITDQAVAYRATLLFDGLSPAVPMLTMFAAWALFAVNDLRRISLVETRCVRLSRRLTRAPKGLGNSEATSYALRLHENIHTAIESPWGSSIYALVAVLMVTLLMRFSSALIGLEPKAYKYWFLVWGLFPLVLTIPQALIRTWDVWRELRKLLEYLDGTVIRETFRTIPKELSSMRIWRIGGTRRSLLIQRRTAELLLVMENEEQVRVPGSRVMAMTVGGTAGADVVQHQPVQVAGVAGKLHAKLNYLDQSPATRAHSKYCMDWFERRLNRRMGKALSMLENSGADHIEVTDAGPMVPLQESQRQLALYLAYRFTALIRYATLHIRNMLLFSIYGVACIFICVVSYPFQGRRVLATMITLLFISLLAAIGVLLVQMEKDPILGRLENAKELGRVDYLGVIGRLITVGGLPLLAILASQFPALAEFLMSWMKPFAEALR